MDLDAEMLARLKDVEDHFTERKEAPHENDTREVLTAFANSAIPDKPGIIYFGVRNNGQIVGGDNIESWQRKVSSWAANCFPPVNAVPRALEVEAKRVLGVLLPASNAKPHFAKAAYVRQGSQCYRGEYEVLDCNQHFVTLRNTGSTATIIIHSKT